MTKKQRDKAINWGFGGLILIPSLVILAKWTMLDLDYLVPLTWIIIMTYCFLALKSITKEDDKS